MLQGSLDNFTLDEVLGLLAGTSKTGRLRVSGDRGTGSLWLHDGQLVDGSFGAAAGCSVEDSVFELMRFNSGNFSFTADENSDDPSSSQIVDLVVATAGERLQEWNEIAAVVPSMDHILTPRPELSADEVTITREQWRLLVTVGSRAAVREVSVDLELGEVDVSRMLKKLIEQELLDINEDARSQSDPVVADEAVADEAVAARSGVDETASDAMVRDEMVVAQPVVADPPVVAHSPAVADRAVAEIAGNQLAIDEAQTGAAMVVETGPVAIEQPVTEVAQPEPKFEAATRSNVSDEPPAVPTPRPQPNVEAFLALEAEPVDDSMFAAPAAMAQETIPAADVSFGRAMTPIAAPDPDDLIEEAVSSFAAFQPEPMSFADSVSTTDSVDTNDPFSIGAVETAAQIGMTDELPAAPPVPRSERPPMPAPPVFSEAPAAPDFSAPDLDPMSEPMFVSDSIEDVSGVESFAAESMGSDMPAPPSPAEIDSFRESLNDAPVMPGAEPVADTEGDEAPSTEEQGGSLLMRYLKSER
ncbi:MAG: hypothetical protein ACI8TP_000187 [Acidimicrobiales bacterium]|jgi:hypothetical protein